jgi:transcriptional regulator GlxA family with amidase domain
MKIAYIIFDGITILDLSGVYEPVCRLKYAGYLPDLSWDFCALTPTAEDHGGLKIIPNQIKNDLSAYDAIIVPGGKGTRDLIANEAFISWIKTAQNVPWKISVCTGSLILGAAGFLKGKKATTHFDAYDLLKPFCREVVTDRIVEDGDCITAGAVTTSIDLGLYLCRKWAGDEADIIIRYKMDYKG